MLLMIFPTLNCAVNNNQFAISIQKIRKLKNTEIKQMW